VRKNHAPVAADRPSAELERRDRLDALAVLAESNDIAPAQIAFLKDAHEILRYLQMIGRFGIQ